MYVCMRGEHADTHTRLGARSVRKVLCWFIHCGTGRSTHPVSCTYALNRFTRVRVFRVSLSARRAIYFRAYITYVYIAFFATPSVGI